MPIVGAATDKHPAYQVRKLLIWRAIVVHVRLPCAGDVKRTVKSVHQVVYSSSDKVTSDANRLRGRKA
jgi:hypothetical protein